MADGLYAAGLSVRDIQAHLEDLYGLRVSPDLISRVTDAVLDEVREWQHRALDRMYPIVIFDALRVKIRDADSRMVKNKAVYIALGVTRDGEREVLGLWIADNEGTKFWLSVMNELRNRGVQDILIAVVDGLKGFPEAITAAFPETMVQTCPRHGLSDQWRSHGSMHLIRHSMNFCSWKEDVRIHDLRHTFASLLVSGGASLEMIGKLLGHSQMQTTLRYAHLMDSPLRAGVDAVASAFRPKPRLVHDAAAAAQDGRQSA